ncbi:interferon a3-like [Nothobranchius furzeri]|uniref:Interferon a3-like n=2 Tax=Nothobranchius furzeri TaxID=105023 RepID=A0A9D3BD88_NOTFU|nr:interferon a3-like [Nothobranchius furzeri]
MGLSFIRAAAGQLQQNIQRHLKSLLPTEEDFYTLLLKMLSRVLFACVCLGLYSACSSLSCRWMDQKFSQFSGTSLDLLDMMANNSTNSTEAEENTVGFPHYLYHQASKASAEDKVAFMVQILEEVLSLFEEDHSSSSWEETTEENFLSVINQQAEELHSCIGGQGHTKMNVKLQKYFKRLSDEILKKMGHSAEAWELIRKEIKAHLIKVDNLPSLLTRN